jgi:hypothetical protein
MILTGATQSSDFPTTAGSPRYGGGEYDAFLAKLNAAGSQLVFSRLIGGSGNDGARHVVVDGAGSLYITGGTGSANFPLVNPIQATFKGGTAPDQDYSWLGPGDAFVAKFDTAGAMTFGTFLGGTGAEAALGIALDQSGTVTVVGGTRSTDLRTANPLRQTNAGQWDVFTYSIGGVGPSPTATPTRYRALLPLLLQP